jgi:hypothetical protein
MKNSKEYNDFSNLLDRVLSVPHSEIKKQLDAEKKTKRNKLKKSSASRAADDRA